MRKKSKPQDLGTIVFEYMKKNGYNDLVIDIKIKEKWNIIIGDRLSKVCQINSFNKGLLIVKVNNASMRNEIYYLKNDILKKIKSYPEFRSIKDIKFI